MQYFRNTSRRAMDYPNPSGSGCFPLCRSDKARREADMRDMKNVYGSKSSCTDIGNLTGNLCGNSVASSCGYQSSDADQNHTCGNAGLGSSCEYKPPCADKETPCGCGNMTGNQCGNNVGTSCGHKPPCADKENPCGYKDEPMCTCRNTPTAESFGCTGLAMAFVPEQEFIDMNDVEDALCRGTLFRQLDMPFYGKRREPKC